MDAPSQDSVDLGAQYSPTDTRYTAPSREDAQLSESYRSTDTVRRRPDVSYGAIQTPPPAGYLGESSFTSAQDYSQVRAGGQSLRSSIASQDRGRPRPRKPPMTRRISSHVQAPHRGEVFSTDDGINEVEEENTEKHQSFSQASSSRQTSTMRRRTVAAPSLSRVHSSRSESADQDMLDEQGGEDETEAQENINETCDEPLVDDDMTGDDDDDDLSDAESFTLKDRQQAINDTHPFGIRLWKPALYKKDRSVQKTAEGDIHSTPGGHVSNWLLFFNIIWTLVFGWWMAALAALGALACFIFAATSSGRAYGRVLWGLAGYLFYPFGKFVRLEQDEAYLDEDQGEGRSISEYEQWQSGDLEYGRLFFGPDSNRSIVGRSRRSIDSEPSETDSLLGRTRQRASVDEQDGQHIKRRLFGRGQWNVGRVIFFTFFYGLITPALLIVSMICWFLVFWIPMGKVTMLLFDHLRRHPLALAFESDISHARNIDGPNSSILLCTYRAVGWKYWKYTVDGTNIFLINLMAVVIFVIFDWLVLEGVLHIESFITSPGFLFIMGLFSIIPLAYFIGQAVASISAQSSMGLGAAINAFFSTIVEVYLYCVALSQGKGLLVDGSIIGSIFAGILFLPGLSMCFGAIKRKTQRFNAKSAGVTSTMLLFATVAAFGPTLFYQIYGTHELNCLQCVDYENSKDYFGGIENERDCRRCYFSQKPALDDRFYLEAVRPYCYAAAILLFLSYIIGLWFTLRTHAAVIWNTEVDEKKHEEHQHLVRMAESHQRSIGEATNSDIRESNLYKRILGASMKQVGLSTEDGTRQHSRQPSGVASANGMMQTPHMVPRQTSQSGSEHVQSNIQIPGFSEAENNDLIRGVTEVAATAAAIAARDARAPRRISAPPSANVTQARPTPLRASTFPDTEGAGEQGQAHGGHDAPNWSRFKSSVILMGATVLYAIVAEILVDTVDVVLQNYNINEKFLGITLFALVPNTTEFLNAISFAMNGNIALSMEIGSAYALQVCLLQIPALVFFSAVYPVHVPDPDEDIGHYIFSLLFPQWDMVTVILCVVLLSYIYGEGKSNYFKGSILLLTYLVVVIGFYFSGIAGEEFMGPTRFDTYNAQSGWTTYKTIGRGTSGRAY